MVWWCCSHFVELLVDSREDFACLFADISRFIVIVVSIDTVVDYELYNGVCISLNIMISLELINGCPTAPHLHDNDGNVRVQAASCLNDILEDWQECLCITLKVECLVLLHTERADIQDINGIEPDFGIIQRAG